MRWSSAIGFLVEDLLATSWKAALSLRLRLDQEGARSASCAGARGLAVRPRRGPRGLRLRASWPCRLLAWPATARRGLPSSRARPGIRRQAVGALAQRREFGLRLAPILGAPPSLRAHQTSAPPRHARAPPTDQSESIHYCSHAEAAAWPDSRAGRVSVFETCKLGLLGPGSAPARGATLKPGEQRAGAGGRR
jgi:hypothetical protein